MKVASIATYAGRLDVLPDAVKSLAGQVDKVVVYFNGGTAKGMSYGEWMKTSGGLYTDILNEDSIDMDKVDIHPVDDLADLSKFRAIWDYPDATIFTCDDDLIYSPDYVRQLTKCLHYDTMVGADVVAIGGNQISDENKLKKSKTYMGCFGQRFSAFTVPVDSRKVPYGFMYPDDLHAPISGLAAFDASKFQDCSINDIYKYAADIQLGAWIEEKGYTAKRVWGYRKCLVKRNAKMKGNRDTIFDNYTNVEGVKLSNLVRDIWKS